MIKVKNKILALAVAITLAATVATAAANPFSDQDAPLTKEIRKELLTLPYYGVYDNLAFKVEGDTVTLFGQVTRPSTRKDAERRVAKIEGVERVINQIKVLSVSSFDDAIRVRTLRAIARSGSLYRYFQGANPSIHIIVDHGNVTLEGVVSSKGDSNLAFISANGVTGVFKVTNNLVVNRD